MPFMKFDGQTVVSSDHAIAFDSIPKKLVVVGGGAIGLEEVADAHDGRRAVELRQGARLVEKAFAAPRELLGLLGRVRQHGGAALAQRQRRRQI